MRRYIWAAASMWVLCTLSACGSGTVTPPPPNPPVPDVFVSVNPPSATVLRDATQTFTATVTNATDTAVTWSVQESSGGTIDSSGNYTPPQDGSGTFHIVATSQGSSAHGTAAIVVPLPQVSINPEEVTLRPSETGTFTASLSGLNNTALHFTVQEDGGGLINNAGLYTAPSAGGIYHVVATSNVESNVIGSSIVTVTTSPGAFTPTGNLVEPRGLHTATLLPDNTVLVAYGSNRNSFTEATGYFGLSSVEVYDPATGKFTEIFGEDGAGIYGHTAALLPNGAVLLAGGFVNSVWDYGGSLSDNGAGLYDSATGQFSGTGSMTVSRGDHTATLLTNGKVLVAGGADTDPTGSGLASAELYDAVAGTFSATGSMSTGRFMHTATLLKSGKVLIVGGAASDTSAPLATAEVYNPTNGTFTLTGAMTMAREQHTATLLADGRVLIVGGKTVGSGGSLPQTETAEIYDPSTQSFRATNSMFVRRNLHTATRLQNGTVLVAGGGEYNSTAEVYDPATGSFSITGGMEARRSGHTATLLPDGSVLVAGGGIYDGLGSAELYH